MQLVPSTPFGGTRSAMWAWSLPACIFFTSHSLAHDRRALMHMRMGEEDTAKSSSEHAAGGA